MPKAQSVRIIDGNRASGSGGGSTVTTITHTHDSRYYTESEVAALLAGYLPVTGVTTGATSQAQTFTSGVIDSSLTASRLLASNGSKQLASVANLADWIAGTANQVTVSNDGDGSVTLALPQNIHTAATPTFAGVIAAYLRPAADGVTAVQIQKANGTPVVTVDTTNGRVGIGITPSDPLSILMPDTSTAGFKITDAGVGGYITFGDATSASGALVPYLVGRAGGTGGVYGILIEGRPAADDSSKTGLVLRGSDPSGNPLTTANILQIQKGDGAVVATVAAAGNVTTQNGLIVNEGGGSAATDDLRAESDTEPNMLWLDASADLLYLGGTVGVRVTKGGGVLLPVATKSGNYTLTGADNVVVFTATATATLPAATGSGQTYRICCRAGTLTIDGNASETVIGEATQVLYPGENLILTDVGNGAWE